MVFVAVPQRAATSLSREGWIIVILMIVPPVLIAFSMPDFKTALIAWFGFPIGMTLARVLTLPLMYVGAQRIEKRLKQGP